MNSFIAFAEDEDEQSLGNIPLSIVLQEWNATSKCNEIILSREDNKIDFYLNGFAPKGKKAPNEIKSKKAVIETFYRSLFPKENDLESIRSSVSTHTTFFIEINNQNSNDAGDIIAAVTFLYDEKKENAMILWLGVLDEFPD